jgi:hypothetical protein
MPNQRKKDKRNIGAWVPLELYEKMKQQCGQKNITLSDFLESSVREGIEKYGSGKKNQG